MFIEIETTSEIPIYTQLVNQLIGLIAAGVLKPNEPLPSVRSLASDLGVNMHTVNKAYHELERKKILNIIPKSGAIVNDSKTPSEEQLYTIIQLLKPIIAEAIVYGMEEAKIMSIASSIISEFKEE